LNNTTKDDEMKVLKAEIKALKQSIAAPTGHGEKRGTRGRNGNRQGRDLSNVKCFNCGEQGHLSPQCPKPPKERQQNGSRNRNRSGTNGNDSNSSGNSFKRPPNEGEPETKTVDGIEWKFCKRCKRWRKGNSAHTTAEHISRRPVQGERGTGGAAVDSGIDGNLSDRRLCLSPNLFTCYTHSVDPTTTLSLMVDDCVEEDHPVVDTVISFQREEPVVDDQEVISIIDSVSSNSEDDSVAEISKLHAETLARLWHQKQHPTDRETEIMFDDDFVFYDCDQLIVYAR
jgi:Zinc knuckle